MKILYRLLARFARFVPTWISYGDGTAPTPELDSLLGLGEFDMLSHSPMQTTALVAVPLVEFRDYPAPFIELAIEALDMEARTHAQALVTDYGHRIRQADQDNHTLLSLQAISTYVN